MPAPFSRSLRAIEDEGLSLMRIVTPITLAFLAGWWLWIARAEVPLHAASTSARLVRERAVHPVESAIDGRIIAVHATLEQPVEAGTLLFELDPSSRTLALAEERARLQAVENEITTAHAALEALESARSEAHTAAAALRHEAELELETRRLALRYAEEEADRLTQLEATGTVSKLSASRARTDADQARVAVQSQEAALGRQTLEQNRDDADRAATIAQDRSALAEKEGARDVHVASIARLEHELAECRVSAPAAGVVAELARLTPGSFVHAGEGLGSVVADGALVVEAEFEPAEALGRIRIGQAGELALTGFPRAEFGALPVSVERIASEARDGHIRVELTLAHPERARVPLEHGLPGSVRIEIERATPATLILRSVGGALGLTREPVGG